MSTKFHDCMPCWIISSKATSTSAVDYSIADMASYPWVVPHKRQLQEIEKFANLYRWFEQVRNRPATLRAYEVAKDFNPNPGQMSEEEKKILFQQDASTLQSLRSGDRRVSDQSCRPISKDR